VRIHALVVLVVLIVLAGCGSSPSPPPDDRLVQEQRARAGNGSAFGHLEAFARIADAAGGNRAVGGSGYDMSVDYVAGVLRDAGFEVSTPVYEAAERDGERSPAVLRSVVAQTRTGDPRRVVMAGAHLDSVDEGPGLNDDASGVAALLEIAQRTGPAPAVPAAVRFAFWGSEEVGLEGSTSYVRGLSAGTDDVLVYLNLDMLGSRNGGYFVQGGEGRGLSETGPPGSAAVARVLTEELARTGVAAQTVPFTGDDESAFVEAGIPTGGALTGTDEPKTAEQARRWGGQPGAPYDPCYHAACDRLDNVDRVSLDRYTDAVAGALRRFASSSVRPAD
jgi:aminopeptidase S